MAIIILLYRQYRIIIELRGYINYWICLDWIAGKPETKYIENISDQLLSKLVRYLNVIYVS